MTLADTVTSGAIGFGAGYIVGRLHAYRNSRHIHVTVDVDGKEPPPTKE